MNRVMASAKDLVSDSGSSLAMEMRWEWEPVLA